MSNCLPGMKCFGVVNPPRGCGIDPCFVYKTGTDLVYYNGPNLPNTGIDTCDTLTLSLQKLDNALSSTTLTSNMISTLSTNNSLKNQLKLILGIS